MPANSCKHRFYFYNLLPEILFPKILFPKILLPESLPEGKPSGREGYLLSKIIVHYFAAIYLFPYDKSVTRFRIVFE